MDYLQNISILLAEDDDASREMLCFFLKSFGCEVIEARNGMEAVYLARERHPDLILMDLNMPRLDGITASVTIRQLAHLSNVPILAASGDGGRGINLFLNIEKLGKGYVEYIAKPIDLDYLIERIKNALQIVQKAA